MRTQVKSILAKLEVTSQLAAVGLAHKIGWRPPSWWADREPAFPEPAFLDLRFPNLPDMRHEDRPRAS